MRRTFPTRLAGVAAGVLLLATACGDDDDSSGGPPDRPEEPAGATTTTGAADGELAAYCEAALAIEVVPDPDLDPSLTGAEADAEAAAWVTEELQPLAEAVVATAPAEIADDLSTQAAAVAEAAVTGDFSSFGGTEVDAAEARTHEFDMANCGWQAQTVTATEYSFGEVPGTLTAGPTSFELSNEGSELHEIVLARKNPGVTDSVEDIVALPDEEALSRITELGSVHTDPGSSDYKVVDLEAGDYIMICFVPMGMTSEDAEATDGAPHYTEGMVAEFTVT